MENKTLTDTLRRRFSILFFPLLGLTAVIWFMVRVLPKPSRASYPCQRIAAGVGGGFLLYLLGGLGVLPLLHKLKYKFAKHRAIFIAGLAVMLVLGGALLASRYIPMSSSINDSPVYRGFIPVDPANQPMGEGKGLFPGRVAWVQERAATLWDGVSGYWWSDVNTNQTAVDNMLTRSLLLFSGEPDIADAWEAIFQHFNEAHGRGSIGYQAGEKIVIKINSNQDGSSGVWDNGGYNSPHLVYALVSQLIEVVGAAGADITIADPSRYVGNPIYNKIRSNPGVHYQAVNFVVNPAVAKNGRVGAVPDYTRVIHFVKPYPSDPNIRDHYPPTCYTEAAYLINLALLRSHSLFGVTLCGKNNFGSVFNGTEFRPDKLHGSGVNNSPLGNPHCHPVLFGSGELGGKTLIFLIDSLYTAIHQGSKTIVKWQTLGNDWCSSLLLSQDPVAIDSVAVDFLRSEPTMQIDTLNQNVCNYLHESALANDPPSGAFYDPENDGTRLPGLGVHEHWNNVAQRMYSRDLGSGSGIELVRDSSGIKLLSPVGGEALRKESASVISWEANRLRKNIKISLWKNGVQTGVIASSVSPGAGSYNWTTGRLENGTTVPAGAYRIKLKELNYSYYDMSAADFIIADLKLTSPNGGEALVRDSIHQVTWQAGGFSNVKITLWQGAVLIGIIADNLPAAPGTYAWQVGKIVGGSAASGAGYSIKIKARNLTISDSSDGSFSIVD